MTHSSSALGPGCAFWVHAGFPNSKGNNHGHEFYWAICFQIVGGHKVAPKSCPPKGFSNRRTLSSSEVPDRHPDLCLRKCAWKHWTHSLRSFLTKGGRSAFSGTPWQRGTKWMFAVETGFWDRINKHELLTCPNEAVHSRRFKPSLPGFRKGSQNTFDQSQFRRFLGEWGGLWFLPSNCSRLLRRKS